VERIAQALLSDGNVQPLSRVHLYRRSVPLEAVYGMGEPSLCVIAQGSKEVLQGGYSPHISKAIERLQYEFDQPLRIEQLAHELGMSASGLHHHFKTVTALSPLQFQKRLRLQEARRPDLIRSPRLVLAHVWEGMEM
jgi:hypothetical protein